MTKTLEQMHNQIAGAAQLQSVVRTMKAQAASSITQYENAVLALEDYTRTINIGLGACFRQTQPMAAQTQARPRVIAIVFGSDQGLVGKFNDELSHFVQTEFGAAQGAKTMWAVGARIHGHLIDEGFVIDKNFDVPTSINAITSLVGDILNECVRHDEQSEASKIIVFYNRSRTETTYEPVSQQLLPLDTAWQSELVTRAWPRKNVPELIGNTQAPLLSALIREHLFIALYRACAESLASENASRLAAMQRAEKNIDSLLDDLKQKSRTLRQNSIDEELFDVIAGAAF